MIVKFPVILAFLSITILPLVIELQFIFECIVNNESGLEVPIPNLWVFV